MRMWRALAVVWYVMQVRNASDGKSSELRLGGVNSLPEPVPQVLLYSIDEPL
jgi:hypothetical protein